MTGVNPHPIHALILQYLFLCKVKRVSANDLSLREFFYSYAMSKTPVVITDLVDKMTDTLWTLQHIIDIAGKRYNQRLAYKY